MKTKFSHSRNRFLNPYRNGICLRSFFMRHFFLSSLIFSLFLPDFAHGLIYKFIDENGVLHFTNVPDSSFFKRHRVHSNRYYNRRDFDSIILSAAETYGLSFSLLKAIITVESSFNPGAVSKKGAMGLMQIMPQNLSFLKIQDPFDPTENIMGGAKYLKMMLKRYKGDYKLALAAYNAGPKKVDNYNGIPPYRETMNYVRKVLKYYNIYQTRTQ